MAKKTVAPKAQPPLKLKKIKTGVRAGDPCSPKMR